MRGSSLSHASVIEILKPFIVTSWTGRSTRTAPAEVRAVYDQVRKRMPSNIVLFVLDSDARVVDAFVPFPEGNIRSLGFNSSRMGTYVRDKIASAIDGMDLPRVKRSEEEVHPPDIDDLGYKEGLRIFLSLESRLKGNYKMPTVEVVPLTKGEKKALAYSKKSKSVDAVDLKGWLEQIYPPAIMERTGYIKSISGMLTLTPAGSKGNRRFALLEGEVQFLFDDAKGTRYKGDLSLVLSYPKDSSNFMTVRGVFEGVYPKSDRMQKRTMDIRMTAALESRPD